MLTPTALLLDPGLRTDLKSKDLAVGDLSALLVNRDSLELPLGQVDGLFGPLSGLGQAVILYMDLSRRHVSYQGKVVSTTRPGILPPSLAGRPPRSGARQLCGAGMS